MRGFLRRENLFFISIFGVISSLLALFTFLMFNNQFTQSYNQFIYLHTSNFEYVYITDDKLPKNSYLDLKNTKSFFLEEELTTRIQVNSLMQLDVVYDETALIGSKNIVTDTDLILGGFELFITLETANTYNLKVDQYIYSKSKIDQQVYAYKIKGIITNVYSTSLYNFSQLKGLLIFGYNSEEEENSDSEYINYSLLDPSQTIVENDVNLLKLYDRIELMRYPMIQSISFILLQALITIIFSMGTYTILIKDLHNHIIRHKRIGAGSVLSKTILSRASSYLFVSLITIIIFNTMMSILYKQSIENIILSIILVISALTVSSISLVVRYRK